MAPHPVYKPASGLRTNIDNFREYVNKKHGLNLKSYHDLHAFSITCLNDFWLAIWAWAGIKSSNQPSKIIPAFFPESRLNYAENLLFGSGKDHADDATAVIEISETNLTSPNRYSWKELRTLTAKYAGVLNRQGVQQGDVIVVVGGNCARSLAILLGAAAVGAIFAGFACDIGEKQLIDRVSQLSPKIIFAELSYNYNGKVNDNTAKITKCFNALKNCKLIVTVPVSNSKLPSNAQLITDLLKNETDSDLAFAQLPFTTPFVMLFSSGTTGTPKGIVHSQGGLTLNGKKAHLLHNNFGPKDIHFHYSGIGWTLWNISLGAMLCGTAMVLYDGSPFYPSPEKFLSAVFKIGVTGYGGSPRFFSELQKRGVIVKDVADVSKMHTLLSTGALLTPGTASWLAESFGPVCQINFTGGTELCGNFVTGTRSLPSYAGELACPELGMDVEGWDANGKKVSDGQAGELVCKKPFPNMPVMLWNDPDRKRYNKSYFSGFKGVWTHGDLIRVNPETGGTYALGRSDGVLNPSGVRFGTSELYNILSLPDHGLAEKVIDGLAIGHQRNTKDFSDPTERVILFLKVAPDHSSNSPTPKTELVNDIKDLITRDLSRRHIPHFFFEVPEIPHNANGKKMEIQVKQVCNGGREVLAGMTLADTERQMLEGFVKFYNVEDVSGRKESGKREIKL